MMTTAYTMTTLRLIGASKDYGSPLLTLPALASILAALVASVLHDLLALLESSQRIA